MDTCLNKERTNQDLEELIQVACSSSPGEAKIIPTDDISVEDALANYCVEPKCRNYGLSPSCPPHVSGPSEFRALQEQLEHAIAVRIVVPSSALFSDERKGIMQLLHETVTGIEQAAIGMGYSESRAFAGGSCKEIFCAEETGCRVLSEGFECRHPQHARPSMSGFGINVSELMKSCGWSSEINVREGESDSEYMSWVAGLILIG